MTLELFPENALPHAPRVLSISELTRSVRVCLENAIGEVWVEGEICNLRKQSSGHQYFGLKDARSVLSCVLFAKAGARQPALAEGMLVQAHGELTVYEARGQYQLVVDLVQAAGVGVLQAKFAALKQRLEIEGLFAAARKKALPRFPNTIALVTSPTGAALRDLLNILQRRAPWLRVIVQPVRVQGAGAAVEIAGAIRELNEHPDLPPVEIIVVSRGGGSAEDLWEFNEEILARAIFASRILVVSAVGHEIDFTIADFVADLRAPTPSAAAELVVPEGAELLRRLSAFSARLQREAANAVVRARSDLLRQARSAALQAPARRLLEFSQRLDLAEEALQRAIARMAERARQRLAELRAGLRQHRPDQTLRLRRQELARVTSILAGSLTQTLQRRRSHLASVEALLRVLSPEATLARGYSITMTARGTMVRSTKDVKPKMKLVTRLPDGTVRSTAS